MPKQINNKIDSIKTNISTNSKIDLSPIDLNVLKGNCKQNNITNNINITPNKINFTNNNNYSSNNLDNNLKSISKINKVTLTPYNNKDINDNSIKRINKTSLRNNNSPNTSVQIWICDSCKLKNSCNEYKCSKCKKINPSISKDFIIRKDLEIKNIERKPSSKKLDLNNNNNKTNNKLIKNNSKLKININNNNNNIIKNNCKNTCLICKEKAIHIDEVYCITCKEQAYLINNTIKPNNNNNINNINNINSSNNLQESNFTFGGNIQNNNHNSKNIVQSKIK